MDYCDVAWSSIGKIERDKLDRTQRRAAKIVLKTNDLDAETDLKWLPLSMRRDKHTINLTFICLKGSPPVFFKDYFKVFRTIHSVMDYCDVAWSSIGKIERDKLDRIQRRAAKIVLKTNDLDAETDLKWLPLSMRRDKHTINLTFKCLKGSSPVFFKDYFKVFRTIHNARESGHNLLLPKVRTRDGKEVFLFQWI